MTEFVYENEKELNLLASRILTEGKCENAYDEQWLDVYKYILAYIAITKEEIGYGIIEKIRRQILEYNIKKENLIFFEKLECQPIDFLFFDNYMRKSERKQGFFSTWYTYFEKVS